MVQIAMSVANAATYSSLSRSFLYLKIKDGTLRTIKVGGRRLILRTDLEAYFETFRTAA
jgi:excisionase family DNA binding protein